MERMASASFIGNSQRDPGLSDPRRSHSNEDVNILGRDEGAENNDTEVDQIEIAFREQGIFATNEGHRDDDNRIVDSG